MKGNTLLRVVLCGAAISAAEDIQAQAPAPAAQAWVDGRVDAALAALQAAPRTRETEIDGAVLRIYAGHAADELAPLSALRDREHGWTPTLRWLARAQADLERPEALETAAQLLARPDADGLDALWAGQLFQRQGRDAQSRAAYEAARSRNPAVDPAAQRVGPDAAPAAARGPGDATRQVPVAFLRGGERLQYEVKYLFLRLAAVSLDTDSSEYGGQPVRRVVFTARSTGSLPLFHIDSRFESFVGGDGAVVAHRHAARDSDTGTDAAGYDMDRATGRCTVRTVRDGLFRYHVLPLPPNGQDGVTILQVARALSRTRGSASVHTAVDGMWWTTSIRTVGLETIRWRGRDVPAVRMQSVGAYRGPAGVSGPVDIWMSDDDQAVPYRVKMKVAVGSVVLELLPQAAQVARVPGEAEVTP